MQNNPKGQTRDSWVGDQKMLSPNRFQVLFLISDLSRVSAETTCRGTGTSLLLTKFTNKRKEPWYPPPKRGCSSVLEQLQVTRNTKHIKDPGNTPSYLPGGFCPPEDSRKDTQGILTAGTAHICSYSHARARTRTPAPHKLRYLYLVYYPPRRPCLLVKLTICRQAILGR